MRTPLDSVGKGKCSSLDRGVCSFRISHFSSRTPDAKIKADILQHLRVSRPSLPETGPVVQLGFYLSITFLLIGPNS